MIYAGATAGCLGFSFFIGIALIAMCNNGDACGTGQETMGELLLATSMIVMGCIGGAACFSAKNGGATPSV